MQERQLLRVRDDMGGIVICTDPNPEDTLDQTLAACISQAALLHQLPTTNDILPTTMQIKTAYDHRYTTELRTQLRQPPSPHHTFNRTL
jgi:hypothetical protein